MKEFWIAFKKFVTRGNVVDMAVGVAVASAFTAIVTAFTKGVISPLLALLTKSSNMADMKWIIREEILEEGTETVLQAEVAILYGAFLQAIIDFLLIAFVLFCVMWFTTAFMKRANKVAQRVHKALLVNDEEVAKRAEEEARAKAEAEAKEKAEAEAKAKAEAEAAARELAKEQATLDTARLLVEIRDLLSKKEQ